MKPNKPLLLILLAALIFRLAAFLYIRPWLPEVFQTKILVEDAPAYHSLALGLLQHKSFESFESFDAMRTPIYPLFIAAVYAAAGVKPWVVLLLQIGINLAALLLIYRLGLLVLNKRSALAACLMFALEPHVIYYCISLLTETLFIFVLLAAVVALIEALQKKSLPLFALGGLLTGLTALIRPISQFFPAVAMVIIAVHAGSALREKLKAFMVYIVLFFVAVSPWLCRNYSLYRHCSLATIGAYNILYYNAFYTELPQSGKSYEALQAEYGERVKARGAFISANPFVKADIYSGLAIDYIKSHPAAYAVRHMKGMFNMFINLGTTTMADMLSLKRTQARYNFFEFNNYFEMARWFLTNKTLHEITLGSILATLLGLSYCAAACGIFNMIKDKNYFNLLVICTIILYFNVISGVIGMLRLKMPVVPFYLLLSGAGLARLPLSRRKGI